MSTLDNIDYYTDYFAWAAESGLKIANSVFTASRVASTIRISSFNEFTDAVVSLSELVDNLESSYERVFISAISIEPMREAFDELSKYIKKLSTGDVDDYFTANNLKVDRTYAQISSILGYTISESNIEEANCS